VFGGTRCVTASCPSSHEVAAPCRVLNLEKLAPALLRRSPPALCPFRLGYRVFALQVPEEAFNLPQDPLLGFGSSSEVAQAPSCCPELLVFQKPDVWSAPNANWQRLP
jgi:hypothetical protein